VTVGRRAAAIDQALASVQRQKTTWGRVHYNVQPSSIFFGAVQGRTSRRRARDAAHSRRGGKELPRGSAGHRRARVDTMTVVVHRDAGRLALAVVLVYLLIVVNFQSWLDPFIIISALPAALAGIVWMRS